MCALFYGAAGNWVAHEVKPLNLTDAEKEVLNHLKDAWNKYASLNGHIGSDLAEFCNAIHLAQQKIALRVARRVDPDIWVQPKE